MSDEAKHWLSPERLCIRTLLRPKGRAPLRVCRMFTQRTAAKPGQVLVPEGRLMDRAGFQSLCEYSHNGCYVKSSIM